MGYTHGIEWNEELIEKAIKNVVEEAKISTFPTRSQMETMTGSTALLNAIRRHGGTRYWAERLGLEMKPSESKLGEEYELICMQYIKHLGYRCERTPARYPYDLLAERNIKVDVKCGNLYKGQQGEYYTFNLEKAMPTCDIFVCYCLDNNTVTKTYVIPSSVLSGKTQLSISKKQSKYDIYYEAWGFLRIFDEFYMRIGG